MVADKTIKVQEEHQYIFIYFIRYLDFKSSLLNYSFLILENIFLEKSKQMKIKENIYTITFRQKFVTQLKSRIVTIKIGVIFFLQKPIFVCLRLNRFLYFWVFNAKFQPIGS